MRGKQSQQQSQGWVRDQVHGLEQWFKAGIVTVAVGGIIYVIAKALGG